MGPGWTATESGYWYSDAEARDLLRALQTNNREVEHWYQAYQDIKNKALDNSASVSSQIEMLKEFLVEERSSSDRAIEKAVKVGNGWGFGPFAGVGYSGDGFNATIGIGIVWRVF